MLERTDRLALAVPDRRVAAEAFRQLYDAEVVDDAMDAPFNAHRLTLGWGHDQLELLEPAGEGPVQAFLSENRRGIFAGGFAAADPGAVAAAMQAAGGAGPGQRPGALRRHARGRGRHRHDHQQARGAGAGGTGHPALADHLRRAGSGGGHRALRRDCWASGGCSRIATPTSCTATTPRSSGSTRKRDGLLDSLEYLDPTDPDKAVARFLRKVGQGIYMASIEAGPGALVELRERVTSTGPGWDGADDILGFIHPLRQHGLLLAIVDSVAWHARRELPGG